jgi:hypothetical protein
MISEVEVQVYRPTQKDNFEPPKFTSDFKVGGYFGFKTCNATTDYALSTNIVNPGETI